MPLQVFVILVLIIAIFNWLEIIVLSTKDKFAESNSPHGLQISDLLHSGNIVPSKVVVLSRVIVDRTFYRTSSVVLSSYSDFPLSLSRPSSVGQHR